MRLDWKFRSHLIILVHYSIFCLFVCWDTHVQGFLTSHTWSSLGTHGVGFHPFQGRTMSSNLQRKIWNDSKLSKYIFVNKKMRNIELSLSITKCFLRYHLFFTIFWHNVQGTPSDGMWTFTMCCFKLKVFENVLQQKWQTRGCIQRHLLRGWALETPSSSSFKRSKWISLSNWALHDGLMI